MASSGSYLLQRSTLTLILGGHPTRVGFDAGDGVNYLNAPNSCTNSIVNISMNSNVGNNGVFVYRVDSNTNNNPEQTNVTCILTTSNPCFQNRKLSL